MKHSTPHRDDPAWRGYDLDEIRYQQAYTLARIEICRDRMAASARSLYGGGAASSATSLMGKLLGSLNYVDYALLAFRLIRRAYGIFRRRRGR